jgi:hypothetical protein
MSYGKIDTVGVYCTTFCCFISLCLLQVIIPKAVLAEIENREFLKRSLFFNLKFSKVSIIRLMTRYITMVCLITIASILRLVISK